jgi:hypothetical protein
MWTELPLSRTYPGTWQVDASRALAAGLRARTLPETITGTWAWMRSGGAALDNVSTSAESSFPPSPTQRTAIANRH